jgi:amino acid adenylation domain-containing protein
MNLTKKLYHNFQNFKNKPAFCIDGKNISYGEFLEYINGTRELIEKNIPGQNNPVGIVYVESIETYAAIFATWFSGNYFVPLNPKHPTERNSSIIKNVGINFLLSAKIEENVFAESVKMMFNSDLKSENDQQPLDIQDDQRMYVLSTSGSTGVPKFVPINMENLTAYCDGFLDRFAEMNSDVRFLQIYDLSVDASVTSYLLPLLVGACVYTLPEGPFKFLTITKMLANKNVNWVKLTPSVLSFLSPHKTKLDFKHIKQIVFGGEALPVSLVKEWLPVFPETKIANHYGPTETTVGVTTYRIDDLKNIRTMNGVVSIGRPFREVESVVLNEKGYESAAGENGELCIAGKQVMKGYLKGDDSSFIYLEINNKKKKFYRTGDIVQKDNDGFIYYLGRTDDQVKIEGHRINLIEIENRARDILPGIQVVMVAHEKIEGIKRLYLFVEGADIDKQKLKAGLVEKLPPKMIPEDIFHVSKIPLTTGGKIDKIKLIKDCLVK